MDVYICLNQLLGGASQRTTILESCLPYLSSLCMVYMKCVNILNIYDNYLYYVYSNLLLETIVILFMIVNYGILYAEIVIIIVTK